ncbi:MAG: hypothetical protein V4529_16600 [Gemmatimonadota bacterium]
MIYVIVIRAASCRGDAYARAGAAPDAASAWVIQPPLAVRPNGDGRYTYVLGPDVQQFGSIALARQWRQKRIAYQRTRRRPIVNMRVMRADVARVPAWERAG